MAKRVKINKKEVDRINQITEQKLNVAASVVLATAVNLCPVDLGNLRNSLNVKDSPGKRSIGTNVEYAPYIEFGTGVYAEEGNGRKEPWIYPKYGNKGEVQFFRTIGQKPKPYLRPALINNTTQIKKIMGGK